MLTQVAGTQTCPSDDVDQAWHLHITRTADYERFCRATLGRVVPRAPAPERQGMALTATLARYRAVFGNEPPPAVWRNSTGESGMSAVPRVSAIRLRGWLASPQLLLAGLVILAVAVGAVLAGAGGLSWPPTLSDAALGGLSLAVPAGLFLLAWGSTLRGGRRGVRDALDPYEAAWLCGGARRMAATAIGVLVARGVVELAVQRDRRGKPRRATLALAAGRAPHVAEHPAEQVCAAAGARGSLTFEAVRRRMGPLAEETGARLARAGLVVDAASLEPARAAPLVVAWLALLVAFSQFAHGAIRGGANGFFLVVALLDAALMAWLLLTMSRMTPRGRSVLDTAGERMPGRSRAAPRLDAAAAAPATLAWSLALVGAPAMMHDPAHEGIELALDGEGVVVED